MSRPPYIYALFMEILLQLWYRYLSEMEYAGGKCRVGVAYGEGISEMLFRPGSSTGDDGYAQVGCQSGQGLVGIALLHSVVIHRREKYFSCSPLLCLVRPLEESPFRALPAALEVAVP